MGSCESRREELYKKEKRGREKTGKIGRERMAFGKWKRKGVRNLSGWDCFKGRRVAG